MAKVKITTTYENGTVTHDMAAANRRTLTDAMEILLVLSVQSPPGHVVRKLSIDAGRPFEALLDKLDIPLLSHHGQGEEPPAEGSQTADTPPATEEEEEQPTTT